MTWSQLLFGFRGRIPRKTWWLSTLAVSAIILLVLSYPMLELIRSGVTEPSYKDMVRIQLFTAPFWWTAFVISAKRLHDRDRTAWWLAVPWLLSLLQLAAFGPNDPTAQGGALGYSFWLLATAFNLWLLIELGFLRDTRGPNRFGSDPFGESKAEIAS